MFAKPKPVLVPNTYAFESEPMVKATGFREYDARWLFGKEINLMGIQALGMGLGALIAELDARQVRRVVDLFATSDHAAATWLADFTKEETACTDTSPTPICEP